MKKDDRNQKAERNVIDATTALKIWRRATAAAGQAKPLKHPQLSDEQTDLLLRYIAARRRGAAADAEAADLKAGVLAIVKVHKQVALKGAVVKLTSIHDWKYDAVITELTKTLADAREKAREDGTALATVTPSVAFEDVRAKERAKRERMMAS